MSLAIWRSHDVAVIAFGHRDESIGPLDAGPAQDVDVGPVADHLIALEIAGQDPSRRRTRKGVRIAVDDDHLVARAIHVRRDLGANTPTPNDENPQAGLIIGTPMAAPRGCSHRLLVGFGRVRFPFTFMGVMALAMGVWVVVYLAGHRTLDPVAQELAGATALVCFGFAAYVLVRRVRRGPQH